MRAYELVFGKLIRGSTDLVITKTTSAEKFMKSKGYKNVITIPVGLDKSKLGLTRYELVKKSSKRLSLLYVGNLEKRRDLTDILFVIKELYQKVPISFVIIGDGVERVRLKKWIEKLGLYKEVTLLGKIPNNELVKYYQQAHFFILPSKYEIYGMVILEAMSCGCPVISTRTAGALDIIKHKENGLLYSTKDELKRFIEYYYTNNKEYRMLQMNALKKSKDYSWNKFSKMYYNAIIGLK